ncbi:LysR family transcriptional regulator [Pseudoflavonifractor sp. 524-17]|uniref:LysR family transcriptional regulator n=1 Tax=Pseudoflavonifractor sp. 524-17 TaxID=2304577 RepID=UPI00137A8DB8|nr:LysR family transcriptional regulator [Pseudoflavonifractor sp. 524-17]NCE64990.1 LysR family transcriptional regulator [Pseudoflavonifractor sp. 524-17]
MRTEYLEYLLEVARTRSISAAAKKLFIGQTTLSAIINSVENELNVKIFQRTHRGVKLTEHGERVIAIAEDMVEKNRQLLNLSADITPVRRNIPLVAYPSACSVLALYLSARLRQAKDEPTLSMLECASNKVVSSVANGMANIGVGASGHAEFFNNQYTAHNNGFAFEPIYNDRFCLCVSGRSRLAEKDCVDVSALGEEHLAVTEHHPSSSSTSVGCVLRYARCFSVFNNMGVVKRAVLAENMAAVLPRLSFFNDDRVASGALRLIDLTGFETGLTNFILVNQKVGLNACEKQLTEFIREFYQELEQREKAGCLAGNSILPNPSGGVQ